MGQTQNDMGTMKLPPFTLNPSTGMIDLSHIGTGTDACLRESILEHVSHAGSASNPSKSLPKDPSN